MPFIVVTDLDGTLLDHHDYSYNEALAALTLLEQRGIPLIFNSSKTSAEIHSLRLALNNEQPYVVENGGGIFIPDHSLPTQGERRLTLGMNRADILTVLTGLRQEGFNFKGFADMTVADLVECTGLNKEAAAQALERLFSEPLLWQGSEEELAGFRQGLHSAGLSLTKGGRFMAVAAPVTKGDALPVLLDYFYQHTGVRPKVVALGDGDNDVPMLEAADYPVLIPSPVNPLPEVRHLAARVAQKPGPAGWNELVLQLVAELI